MINETKKIGEFTCSKSVTLIEVNSMNNTKELDYIQVSAWYSTQIPVNQGPREFWGLPGLILEIETEINIITCSKIVINKEKIIKINLPPKEKRSLNKSSIQ